MNYVIVLYRSGLDKVCSAGTIKWQWKWAADTFQGVRLADRGKFSRKSQNLLQTKGSARCWHELQYSRTLNASGAAAQANYGSASNSQCGSKN
jgi:hypothetical protein